ncbi:acyltransferase [Vibrio metoecus]|uniref:acyltransferase family protein n=1 Tax=Vibrio metoecus TaxID=1481663 RepID=UPI0006D7CFC7|nr:acyltransferase family protein [Vibrio metoecus]PAR48244.1 acyltransferase [Vibrio metoecus]
MNRTLPHKSDYRPEIDGLRAFAVISVVIFHAFPSWLKGGFIGVDIFFVISGFLITSHIFEKLNKGQFSFIDFFSHRIKRIFPTLSLVMGCSLVFGWFVLLSDEYAQLGKHIASGAVFIINFILVGEHGYFDNATETKPMLHLWSLAVEEQFYIFWPLILWMAWKCKLNLLITTISVAAISFFLNLYFVSDFSTEVFFLPIFRFWEILSGSLLAWLNIYKPEFFVKFKMLPEGFIFQNKLPKTRVLINFLMVRELPSFIGFSFLIFSVVFFDKSLLFPYFWALIPVFGTMLIIVGGSNSYLNRLFLMNPISIWFGLISYSLYLWHWPILSFVNIICGEHANLEWRILVVLFSIVLAWITYVFYEKPIRFSVNFKGSVLSIFICLCLQGLFGFLIYQKNGITENNSHFKLISDAKGDWDFPRGLFRQGELLTTSTNSPTVLLFGDSLVEQYSPRVVELYKRGRGKDAGFLTRGGCASVPNSYRGDNPQDYIKKCAGHFDNFYKILSENPIDTIILSGAYTFYFKNESVIYIDESGLIYKGDIARKKSIEKFTEFVIDLSRKYSVVVLLPAPIDDRFNPSQLLFKDGKRSILLKNNISSDNFIIDTSFDKEMMARFLSKNITVLSQSTVVCPGAVCNPLTEDGEPKYKDAAHMRPFFVKKYMSQLDEFLLKSND